MASNCKLGGGRVKLTSPVTEQRRMVDNRHALLSVRQMYQFLARDQASFNYRVASVSAPTLVSDGPERGRPLVADQCRSHPSGCTLFFPFRGPNIGTHHSFVVLVDASFRRAPRL